MMNRSLLPGAFILVSLILATIAPRAGAQPAQRYVPGRVIIKFLPSTPPAEAAAIRTSLGASVAARFRSSGAELWRIEGIDVDEVLSRFENDPRVDYIEPDYIVQAVDLFPNDPRFPEMWGLHNTGQTGGKLDADIDAPEAWSSETGGDVLVGVIDTGCDWHHVDLAANIFTNPGEVPANGVDDDGNGYVDDLHGWDFVNNDNDPTDDHGHGTHTSGTVAAVGNNGIGVVGVSWTARILPLKFLDAGGFGSTSNAILAVEYATAIGARLTSNSWGGGGFSDALRTAIEDAGNNGILFVAAAGNASSNNDLFPNYPSNYDLDNIIAVASTDHNDNMSSFSNYGLTTVDLGAPGSNILSTLPGNGYGTASGTSMATPHVSGAASLLWSAAPLMTAADVKSTILSSVDVIPALVGRTVTGGRLNIFNMISGLDSIPPARVNTLAVVSTGSTTATLEWTATGDDGTVGTARVYDLRYSTSQIYWSNFDSATVVAGLPEPAPAGSPETFMVTGLDFSTRYYFALVVEDEQDNRSWLSNLPNGMTLGVPQLAYFPAYFVASLPTGGTTSQPLTIRNTGEGTLDFSLETLPSWLRASPPSGRAWAGESVVVDLIFDATRMAGGDHVAEIDLKTNDPSHASTLIPVVLHATNASDISVSPNALDFGVRYTGICVLDTVVVTNIGTALLNVSGLSTDHPEFSVDPSGFVLGLDESVEVVVQYCPLTIGVIEAALTIQSDDPDHPAYVVALRGEGIAPPVIAVSPASLSENLFTGGISTQPLTIANNGGSVLNFEVTIEEPVVQSALRARTGGGDLADRRDGTDASRDVTSGESGARALAASQTAGPFYNEGRAGIRGAPLDPSGGPFAEDGPSVLDLKVLLLHSASVSEIQGLLLAFPDISIVDAFDGRISTPTLDLLDDYDAVILIANSSYMDPTMIGNVLADYVDMGGGVIMTLASFISGWNVGGRFQSGGYYPFTLGSGPVGSATLAGFDANHPIMEDVTTAWGDLLGATTLAPGAEWVADWTNGEPFVATQGEHVAGVNIFLNDGGFWMGDIPLILHNAVLWTSGAAQWLAIEPSEGTVPAGGSVELAVTFDATGQYGGDYNADVMIANNDPLNPAVTVPAHLHVTGAPDIEISATAIDFGPVFVGGTAAHVLTVSNAGTDQVVVSSISSSHGDYTTDVASFTLAPTESRDVEVTFAPTTAAPILATLTITSNDPDEGVLLVALTGEGLMPPIISVSPDSLADDLFTGETSLHTLTISNSGASNLEFDIGAEEIEALGGPQVTSRRIHIPSSAGDFPRGSAPSTAGRLPASASGSGPAPGNDGAAPDPSSGFSNDIVPGVFALNGSAFSTEANRGQAARFNLNVPEVLKLFGSAPDFIWAGDFGVGDNSFAYAVNEWNQFMRIDTLGGAQTILGTITPFGSEVWTGMALDPTDGTMYATSTNISSSSLYRIDVAAVTSTRIGAVGKPGIIALAVDTDGAMWAHDIVTDELISINKATGAGTAVGYLGFDANFGQGMGFDPVSDQLYLAAFNNYTFQAELRIADRTTGATALVGVLGATSPGGDVQLGWLGIPGLSGVRWLVMDPRSGIVPPGTSMDVDVTFDAEGLFGGNYDAHIVVSNNDPLNPEVRVPAHLHVTGAPDIALSETLVDWGPVFVGAAIPHTITISNPGTDVLVVSSIASDHVDFTVDVTSFSLAAHASQDVVVTFAPSSVAPILGTLEITSNDPDEGVLEVALHGEGLEAPIIAVAPDSLADSLFTGETSTQLLHISNSGGNDLVWNARALEVGALGTRSFSLTAPVADVRDPETGKSAPSEAIRTTPITAALADLTDVHIMWELMHGGLSMYNWSILIADLTARGATVTENFDPITPALLENYDLIWVTDFYTNWTPAEKAALHAWVAAGGALIFESDQAEALINELLSGMGSGLTYLTTSASYGTTTAIFPHETTENVSAAYLSGPLASLDVVAPAGRLVDDMYGLHAVAYSEVAAGRIVAVSDEIFGDWAVGWDDNQLFGNQVVDWLAGGVGWLTLDPSAGTVPPDGSQDVIVTFDARGQNGGEYDAHILIANNDPLNPEAAVPAHLHVTGAPDIALSATSLDWGSVYIGAAIPLTITVTNEGTDLLSVSGITSSHADYTVDVSSFTLAPTATQDVVVTFAPSSAAPILGTLSVASDDPDEAVLEVALQGVGLVPPVISVTPDSLEADLYSGGTSTQQLTISNTGGSDLSFDVFVIDISSPASAAAKLELSAASAGYVEGSGRAAQARSPDANGSVEQGPTPNETNPTTDPPHIMAQYTGDFLHFGITEYGEIMPFQYPVGNEHLLVGTYLAGYTVAYRVSGVDNVGWAGYATRSGITPVSYVELVNDPARVVVEVVTKTTDGRLGISQQFTFERDDKFIGIRTRVENLSGGPVDDVVFKNFADWDVDWSPSSDNWDYDLALHMAYAWENHYTAIASSRTPALMDMNGWDDYARRETSVDFPTGPIFGLDGVEVLHFEAGDLGAGQSWSNVAGYAAGDNLADLQRALRKAIATWLLVAPTSGVVPPGGSAVIDVTFDAAQLIGGDYHATIVVENNDPLNPEVPVPAHMHVTGAPDIAVSDSTMEFGTMFVGATVSLDLLVSNSGTDLLSVSGISSANPDLTFDPLSFDVPVFGSQNVTVSFTPSVPGPVAGTFTIASNDPDEAELSIPFTANALVPPAIVVVPDSLSEALFSGETSTQALTIGNPGGSPLTFAIAAFPAAADSGGAAPEAPQAVSWLTFAPTLGIVEPAGSGEIAVHFNAVALVGGVYHANLVITTNVPGTPTLAVPVEFIVTGVPSIAVSDSLLDFEEVFIGFTKSMQFVVSNLGSETLVVSDISANVPSFAVTPQSFSLAPLAAQVVSVEYTPAEAGPVAGLLTISSNDPDSPAVVVGLAAEAFFPPIMTVSPASIDNTLAEGESHVDSVTISNSGGSALTWRSEITIPAAMIAEGRRAPFPAEPLSAVHVLWHGDHGWGGIGFWSTIVSYLTSHGATVTESSAPIDDNLLAGVDILWFGNRETEFAAAEMEAIHTWMTAGGHVLIEADSDGSRLVYNLLLESLGSGIGYFALAGVGGATPWIYPHETTVGVDEIYLISAQKILVVSSPAGPLVDDAFNRTVIAYDVIGNGRLIVMGDHTFHDVAINNSDNKIFAIQVFEWFGTTRWLHLEPALGTVAAGESAIVTATSDASFLAPGVFELVAVIRGNDPTTPSFSIPVSLTVTPGGGATGIEPEETPQQFALHENHPNPFNPTTTIGYDLPKSTRVRLVIYDVSGREIRELVDTTEPPGRRMVEWDGRNESGETVASGVYFYRLIAGDFVQTKKMVFLK